MHNKDGSRNAGGAARCNGFLSRLLRDARGNTLAIVGAALVPLAAMIGSGVDMSRAYMAKTRLQSACDAAALAGRRVMEGGALSTAVTTEATRFFNFNFPQRLYQTTTFTPVITVPTSGTVRVTAATRIPTTIMKMFGFVDLPLSATCDASLDFVNTDVMLVLDTTGSMGDSLAGTSKIAALRDAVMALYVALEPTQQQLESNGLRLRYGVVPYSSAVNVGNLINDVNPSYLRDSSPYQSRAAYFNDPVYTAVDTPITTAQAGLAVNPGVQRFRTNNTDRAISNTNCGYFGSNRGFTQSSWTYTAIGPNNDADVYDPDGSAGLQASAPNSPTGYVRYQFSRNTPSWSGNPANRVCDRNVTVTRRSYTTRYRFSSWIYRQESIDTTQLRGGTTTIASNTSGTVAASGYYNERQLVTAAQGIGTTSVPWNGCIEERDTTDTIVDSTDLTIPAAAFDLNINLIPSSEETRWRPHWPRMVYRRTAGSSSATSGTQMAGLDESYSACPTEARRMQVWNRGNMQSYVNSLRPIGGTYHDIGMIWGARMLSNGGIFAADNPDNFNQMSVTRHIIFMTDDALAPNCDSYSSYGVEQNDRRVTGSSSCSGQYSRHMQRFEMICNAARGMGFSIWVIAFGTSLTDEMEACASNLNQASTSANGPALIARFQQIGANIGALRLTR